MSGISNYCDLDKNENEQKIKIWHKNNRKILRLFLHIYADNKINKVEVLENAIKIVFPLFEKDVNLTEEEKVINKLVSKTMLKPISEIARYIPFWKSKITKLLKDMGEKGVLAIEGKGRGTKYIIK